MNVFAGIGLQLAATFFFMLMSALIRSLGDRIPVGEIMFARSFFALLPLLAILIWRRELEAAIHTNNLKGQIGRSIIGMNAMFANFSALARLPLADATAIGFTTPLISVGLAAIFLGEAVRKWRWSAVAVGFAGVLVMLSPHLGGAQAGANWLGVAFALIAAFLVAVAMTQVRHLTVTETTSSLVFYFSATCSVGGLATLPLGWVVPSAPDAAILLAIGLVGGVAQILLTESYRHAAAAVVAPFAYTAMVWSVALGYGMLGEVPDPVVLLGASIVVGAGLFVIWRERRLGLDRRAEKQAETPPSGPPV